MANLTIAIDAEVLRAARQRAGASGRSVNALLREYLESYAATADAQRVAVANLIELARKSRAASGGKSWSREDLHAR